MKLQVLVDDTFLTCELSFDVTVRPAIVEQKVSEETMNMATTAQEIVVQIRVHLQNIQCVNIHSNVTSLVTHISNDFVFGANI